jgi:hypothetical protein
MGPTTGKKTAGACATRPVREERNLAAREPTHPGCYASKLIVGVN